MGEWVLGILEQCNFGPIMIVNLGISFTASKGIEGHENYQTNYMDCPKSAASFNERFKTREDAYEWAKTLNSLNNTMEIMTLSFLFRESQDTFSGSGWTGRTPVAAHLWIAK